MRSGRPWASKFIRSCHVVALGLGGLAVAVAARGQPAEVLDLHEFFEERCGACHGHAGALARDALALKDGELRGRHGDVRAFLKRHHGPLTDDEVGALYQMFFRQVEAGGAFKDRCGMCHRSASELARKSLIVVNGELAGRYSGQRIRLFLMDHGRLSADETEFFYDALLEVARGRR